MRYPDDVLVDLCAGGDVGGVERVAGDADLAARVGRGLAPSTARIWANGRVIVLPDWRLRDRSGPGTVVSDDGKAWTLCGRTSGGAAVAHGPGTLNMSLAAPLSGARASYGEAYRLWISILDLTLQTLFGLAVAVGPVEGGFCPGHFDALHEGQKLAGVAQARRRGALLVHGTILVHVDVARYLRLVEAADRYVGILSGAARYDNRAVVSLHDLVGRPVEVDAVAFALQRTLSRDQAPEEAR